MSSITTGEAAKMFFQKNVKYYHYKNITIDELYKRI